MENIITFKSLATKFLAWCESHQSPRTHEWYAGYLNKFMAYPGVAETPAPALKPFQVVEWIDSHGKRWGDTYRGGAVIAVKRVYNWGEELGYVESNPVKKLKKPQAKRREIYMTPEDYGNILALINGADPFLDIFKFVWQTGARPQEARHIEARHVQLENERIVFPAEESKGKRTKRIIYLQGETLEIITRLIALRPDGKAG